MGRLTTLARTSLLLPASSEVDERQHFGNVGSTAVYTGEGQAGAAPSRIYHSNREKSVSSSSHILSSTGEFVAMYSHKRKSSRESKRSKELHSERENGFSPNIGEVRDLHEVRADYAISEKVETFRGTSAVGLRTFEK